jgi:hypothetical protein
LTIDPLARQVTERIGQTKRNCDKITMAAKAFLSTYQSFANVTVRAFSLLS